MFYDFKHLRRTSAVRETAEDRPLTGRLAACGGVGAPFPRTPGGSWRRCARSRETKPQATSTPLWRPRTGATRPPAPRPTAKRYRNGTDGRESKRSLQALHRARRRIPIGARPEQKLFDGHSRPHGRAVCSALFRDALHVAVSMSRRHCSPDASNGLGWFWILRHEAYNGPQSRRSLRVHEMPSAHQRLRHSP